MKITKQEKLILSSLKSEWKYIARDEDGHLYIYKVKPIKIDGQYCCDMYTDYCDFLAFNHLFEFISLNDENPHSINILINYY